MYNFLTPIFEDIAHPMHEVFARYLKMKSKVVNRFAGKPEASWYDKSALEDSPKIASIWPGYQLPLPLGVYSGVCDLIKTLQVPAGVQLEVEMKISFERPLEFTSNTHFNKLVTRLYLGVETKPNGVVDLEIIYNLHPGLHILFTENEIETKGAFYDKAWTKPKSGWVEQ